MFENKNLRVLKILKSIACNRIRQLLKEAVFLFVPSLPPQSFKANSILCGCEIIGFLPCVYDAQFWNSQPDLLTLPVWVGRYCMWCCWCVTRSCSPRLLNNVPLSPLPRECLVEPSSNQRRLRNKTQGCWGCSGLWQKLRVKLCDL